MPGNPEQFVSLVQEALKQLPTDLPDVILMEINLPDKSGIVCVRGLRTHQPRLLIIMLTIEANRRRVFESLAAGATGYLLKNLPPAKILAAIAEVRRGRSLMSIQIARMLVETFHQRSGRRKI